MVVTLSCSDIHALLDALRHQYPVFNDPPQTTDESAAAVLVHRLTAVMNDSDQMEYVEGEGRNCPHCGTSSDNFVYDSMDVDAATVAQRVRCGCGHVWHDVYRLSGFEPQVEQ